MFFPAARFEWIVEIVEASICGCWGEQIDQTFLNTINHPMKPENYELERQEGPAHMMRTDYFAIQRNMTFKQEIDQKSKRNIKC